MGTNKVYLVDDPSEYKVHEFSTKRELMDFLSPKNFDSDPYDEVTVFEAQQIKPKLKGFEDE